MTTIAIVTSTENGGIGINGNLPWINLYLLKDAYEELAKNNVVLVGRSSFTTHEHLRGSITYVYSKEGSVEESETVKRISGTPEEVIAQITEENPDKNIIIAGGANVFKEFYNLIDEWRITYIKEFAVFNKDIDITNIQYVWNKKRIISAGTDNNKEFEVWHYTK